MRAPNDPENTARVEFTVQFSHGPKGRRRAREASKQPPPAVHVPKITRLLVLGHHFEWLVREGVVKDYAEIARLTGLTRARITQIVNLTLLAPGIQETILFLHDSGRRTRLLSEPVLRNATTSAIWDEPERRLLST